MFEVRCATAYVPLRSFFNHSCQERCNKCKNRKRDCIPSPINKSSPKGTRAKCLSCRSDKVPCSWGILIPKFLNPVKVAIHEERLAALESQEHSEDPRSQEFLKKFKVATEVALLEADVAMREASDRQVKGWLNHFCNIRK